MYEVSNHVSCYDIVPPFQSLLLACSSCFLTETHLIYVNGSLMDVCRLGDRLTGIHLLDCGVLEQGSNEITGKFNTKKT